MGLPLPGRRFMAKCRAVELGNISHFLWMFSRPRIFCRIFVPPPHPRPRPLRVNQGHHSVFSSLLSFKPDTISWQDFALWLARTHICVEIRWMILHYFYFGAPFAFTMMQHGFQWHNLFLMVTSQWYRISFDTPFVNNYQHTSFCLTFMGTILDADNSSYKLILSLSSTS